MGETFAIKDWPETFEFNESRKIKGALKWVRFPCRQDSGAFVKLSRTRDGVTAIGLFNMLVQVGARCPTRGVLHDDSGPWTPERFADRFGLHDDSNSPEAQAYLAFVKDSWERLVRCGWLVTVEQNRETPGDAGRHREMPGGLPDKEKKQIKETQQQQDSVVVVVGDDLLRKALQDAGIVGKTLDELAQTAIQARDVRAEASKIKANKGGTGALVNRLREIAANPAQPKPVTAPRPRESAPAPPVDPEAEKQRLRARLETASGAARRMIENELSKMEGAA